MAELNKEQIQMLAQLCNFSCNDEEKLLKDLQETIKYFETLQEIPTEDIEPCFSVLKGTTPLREDNVENVMSREAFLDNAQHTAGLIRVPSVLKKSS